MKVLVTAQYPKTMLTELKKIASCITFAGRGFDGYMLNQQQMIKALDDVDMVINGVEKINAEVMDACPKLKIIACARNEAFASVDIDAATKRNIPVLGAVGRNAVSVAEFTFALLLSLSKNIYKTDYLMRYTDELVGREYEDQKNKSPITKENPPSFWSTDPTGPSALYGGYPEIKGKNFGIVGLGSIGKEIARIALGFGAQLLINDPFTKNHEIEGMDAKLVDLETLMRQSDFISLSCNVNKSTLGMISREMLSLMKPTAFIVNTARAPIMDYDALYDVLREKRIAGAALDVFPQEPIKKGDPFLKLENVVLTPHIAGQSQEIPYHQTNILLKNINMLLNGEPPQTICNLQVLDSWFENNKDLLKR